MSLADFLYLVAGLSLDFLLGMQIRVSEQVSEVDLCSDLCCDCINRWEDPGPHRALQAFRLSLLSATAGLHKLLPTCRKLVFELTKLSQPSISALCSVDTFKVQQEVSCLCSYERDNYTVHQQRV